MAANFDMVAGDTKTLSVDVKDPLGTIVNITTASAIAWQLATTPFGSPVTLEKGMGSGVTITNPTGGIFTVRLDSADTILLGGIYYHFARITMGSEVATIFLGVASITPGVGIVTPDMVMARFPEFSGVSRITLQMIIDESSPQVGESWISRDRVPALLYLVAHKLTLEGEPARSSGIAAGGSGGNLGVLKRRKVGDVEVEYQNANERYGIGVATAIGRAGYELSTYGRQFQLYVRRNFPTIMVV